MVTGLTGKAVHIPLNHRLISTTDLKGVITYANDDFVSVSGFTREELVGQQHSIVRHPFMPKVAFADLWKTVAQDKAWRGIVVNRCKNGDYYWVDAYVTPIYRDGKKVGYQSVRVAPPSALVTRTYDLYSAINNKKPVSFAPRSTMRRVCVSLLFISVLFASFLSIKELWVELVGFLLTQVSAAGILYFLLLQPLGRTKHSSATVVENALIQKVFSDSMDEWGQVQLALMMESARIRTVLGRVEDYSGELDKTVQVTEKVIRRTREGLLQQDQETDMVATAVTQLASSAVEIANNMSDTSAVIQEAHQSADQGTRYLRQMVSSSLSISEEVSEAAEEALLLKERTKEIEHVIEVISSIAEQTNLLALNAAIEAARAGEYGRGFAVVADEVRTLATRTKESTNSVRETVLGIVNAVSAVVNKLETSKGSVDESRQLSDEVSQMFLALKQAIEGIAERSISVSSAAEQQTAVIDEIQKNVECLRSLSANNAAFSDQSEATSKELREMQAQLTSMVKAFDQS